jgi:hypothetical protein
VTYSVTFDPSVGGDGSQFDDSSGAHGMADGQHAINFFPLLQQYLAVAAFLVAKAAEAADYANTALNAPGTQATTSSSVTVGTGSKTIVLNQSGKAFVKSLRVRIASDANVANYVEGAITSFSGTNMTINADSFGGSGNFADGIVTPAVGGGVPASRTISAAGLATGGGDLSANRTITVTEANAAAVRAGAAHDKVLTPGGQADALAEVALQYGATITTSGDAVLDASKFIYGSVTMGGNATLPNLTNATPGVYRVRATQDATGNRKITSWGGMYRAEGGMASIVLSTAPGAVDYLYIDVDSNGIGIVSIIKSPTV